jgi:serine/threonine protein kinase
MSPTAARDRFAPGMRIGDYQIERELADEATGVVYLGTHTVLPRQAGVKVMHAAAEPPRPGEERGRPVRVLQEAILLESLSHPGIPRVFECGTLPDRRPWAAFERLEGVTLASLISGGPMTVADLVVVLRDVGDLLAHAHARGVVHRRLTADAIVRTPDRGSSVSVRHWADARMSTEGRVDPQADPQNDVHALGVVAFHALVGADPEEGAATADRCPGAPAELASLIDQMLAGDAASRPPSDEVRDRARWLADTFEPRMSDRLRWTPPLSVTADAIPRYGPDDGGPPSGSGRRRH